MARAARLSSRVDISLFVGCMLLSLVTLVLPTPMRDPLAGTMRRYLVAPLVGLQSSAERWRAAWLLSQQRTLSADSIALRSFQAKALETENAQLRKLLGLGARLQSGFVPAEAVHNAVREDVVTTLTLTAGSNVGVKTYSPVVAPEGIVGLVQTADPNISIAILFSHPDFRASAMSGDTTAFGIVYPHLGVGAQRYLLELRGVPFRTTLKPGAGIYTSGLGGTFPRGIPIGTVIREMKTVEGWTRTYLVQPAVNPTRVSGLMILLPAKVSQGVANTWPMISNLDSLARAVALANDSVARAQALDSARRVDSARTAAITAAAAAAGRPYVLDSIRADSARRAAAAITAPASPTAPATAPRSGAPSTTAGAAPTGTPVRRDSLGRVIPPRTPAAAATPLTPADSAARAAARAARAAARRDSVRRDSARAAARRDSAARRDTSRRDTLGRLRQ